MVKKLQMNEELSFSRFALGFWRLMSWGMSDSDLLKFIERLVEIGITTMDHADIYGGYQCEEKFGRALVLNPSLRLKMQLVTKCGIKLVNEKRKENTFHCYDTSREYIISSAERALKNFNTDFIDVLLIHRLDYLMNADEVAEAFFKLKKEGKVLHFGVSNFNRAQVELLTSRLDFPLATNQIELNLFNLTHMDNGDLDYMQQIRMKPMIWSPLAGGRIFTEQSEQADRIRYVLGELKEETGAEFDRIALAWLLKHPTDPNIVLGSGNMERIQNAVKSIDLKLTNEQWYRLWTASKGHEVP